MTEEQERKCYCWQKTKYKILLTLHKKLGKMGGREPVRALQQFPRWEPELDTYNKTYKRGRRVIILLQHVVRYFGKTEFMVKMIG